MVVSIPVNNFFECVRDWDIHHITSSSTYRHSNGLAERAVRYAMELSEKCHRDDHISFLHYYILETQPKIN